MGNARVGRKKPTEVRRLAGFVAAANVGDMTSEAREELRKHILDSVGVAIGALALRLTISAGDRPQH
jgi:2-methylcitrate dehydratase PrpD